MADTDPYTRASKIRRFGPLASAANRNLQRDGLKGSLDKSSPHGQQHVALSTDVQRSLLHVGMKVRKSVLNGYKTGLEALEQALGAASALEADWEPPTTTQSLHMARPASGVAAPKSTLTGARGMEPSNLQHGKPSAGRKKRLLEDDIEAPLSPSEADMVIDSVPATLAHNHDRKVRRFAIPRSRRTNPLGAQPMDLDPFIYTDEQGDFAEADFLVPE